ncbi:MAG: GntR family transcriptional regulator [Candidatus Hodarchaeota archaeon]|jgi:DNA-binding GntR family transcriptional regulator
MNEKSTRNTKIAIYKRIKQRIMEMDLKPGDILSDRKLAKGLKVSRTPVREALNLLQKEDYVDQHPGRGFYVKEISLKTIKDMYEVRESLEVTALRLAAKNDIKIDLERIGQLLRHHEKIIKTYKPYGKFLEDAEFHKSLISMSRNKNLVQIVESIFERIQMLRNIEGLSRKRVQIAFNQHLEIFEYLRKGLFSEAEKRLSKHILDSKDDLINRVRNRFEILYFEKPQS